MWHTHGPRKGEPRGYCFVEYHTRAEAESALKMDGKMIHGRPLVVRFAFDKVRSRC
jgi:RNA recognition motif-containing protein